MSSRYPKLPVNPIDKKICVSLLLDELFEAVDEGGKTLKCGILETGNKGNVGRASKSDNSRLCPEKMPFQGSDRPRKYRNAWRISRRETYYFRKHPPVAAARIKETDSPFPAPNPIYVKGDDKYGLKTAEVDVALSASLLDRKDPVYRGENPGKQAKKKMSGSTQTENPALEAPPPEAEAESRDSKGKASGCISLENKCFLVAKSEKSTNLAAVSTKATQACPPGEVDSILEILEKPREGETGSVNEKGELEEIFNCTNSRKQPTKLLRCRNCIKINKSIREYVAVRDRLGPGTDCDVIGDVWPDGEDWMTKTDIDDPYVVKRGFCDVTVKTLMKANEFMCYMLSVPWELTNLGEVVIKEDRLIYHNGRSLGHPNGCPALCRSDSYVSDSLTALVGNRRGKSFDRIPEYPGEGVTEESEVMIEEVTEDAEDEEKEEREGLEEGEEEECDNDVSFVRCAGSQKTYIITEDELGEEAEGEPEKELEKEPKEEPVEKSTKQPVVEPIDESLEEPMEEPREEIFQVIQEETEEKTGATEQTPEESFQEKKMIIQSLAPEIMEELKQFTMKHRICQLEDKACNTEPMAKENAMENDMTVQWELEIEIESDGGAEEAEASQQEKNSSDVVLVCKSPEENRFLMESPNRRSSPSDIEECYLRDEKNQKTYPANVPRRFLHITEQKLRGMKRY